MKKIICLSIFLPTLALAEGINFEQIFKETRVGVFTDQHLNRMTGVYTTLLGFHDASGTEYVNLNIGYLTKIEQDKQSPLLQVGFRLDNLLARARSSAWGRSHTTLSQLPSIEFGPFISTWFDKEGSEIRPRFLYGAALAVKL